MVKSRGMICAAKSRTLLAALSIAAGFFICCHDVSAAKAKKTVRLDRPIVSLFP